MHPRILHIYGPLWINSYGVMIALGLIVFLFATLKHPTRKKYFNIDQYLNTIFVGLISGIIGGRLLYVLTHLSEFADNWISAFYVWEPGLFILGALVSIALLTSIHLRHLGIPIFPVLDMAAVYTPLFQAIARTGCLLAGCCYGAYAPNLPWAIIFTSPDGSAPLFTPLHPTQLYISLLALLSFFVMLKLEKPLSKTPGLLFCLFLLIENASRFFIDFWRGDREFFTYYDWKIFSLFSQAQVLAIICFIASLIAFFAIWNKDNN